MVESNPFDVFDPPATKPVQADTVVRSVRDLFALAAEGDDVAANTMAGLRMIVEAATAGLSGASPHVVDLAVVSIASSVERVSQHFSDDIAAADVTAGLGSAGGIVRTFAMSRDDADWPPSEDLAVWLDVVPILLSQMTGALHWQRIRARGGVYAAGLARAAAASAPPAATKH